MLLSVRWCALKDDWMEMVACVPCVRIACMYEGKVDCMTVWMNVCGDVCLLKAI